MNVTFPHRIKQGKHYVLSLHVLSSCGLPLPPTFPLVTVNEARSYFASTIHPVWKFVLKTLRAEFSQWWLNMELSHLLMQQYGGCYSELLNITHGCATTKNGGGGVVIKALTLKEILGATFRSKFSYGKHVHDTWVWILVLRGRTLDYISVKNLIVQGRNLRFGFRPCKEWK
jgi:hypothetical protein